MVCIMEIILKYENGQLSIRSENGRLNKRTRRAVIHAATALADLQTTVNTEIQSSIVVSNNSMSMVVDIKEKG